MDELQPVVIVPAKQWDDVLRRLTALEQKATSSSAATNTSDPAPSYLTSAEAAKSLGVKPEAIRRANRRGHLETVMLDERSYGFSAESLDKYANRYKRPNREPAP